MLRELNYISEKLLKYKATSGHITLNCSNEGYYYLILLTTYPLKSHYETTITSPCNMKIICRSSKAAEDETTDQFQT